MNNNNFLDKNILLIDDSKTILMFLASVLKKEGYTNLHSALSAKKAYSILKNKKINLILLDVVMPDIDGVQACQSIRNTPETAHIPIIMVTGDDSDETLKKSFDAGADDFTTKPINFMNLNTRIKSVLSHKEKDLQILNQTRYTAMNDMIDTLAHQWRQPLAAISAAVLDIEIAYELDELTPENMKSHLKNINNYTQDLSKTIDEFRSLSKVESKAKEVNINKLLSYTMKIISSTYMSQNISLEVKEQTNLKPIFAYPNELVRVLLSFFQNTQEAFSKVNKDSKKTVQIKTRQDNFYTTISIKDNAGGISKENLLKVFDPYFSTKKEKNGKGLGLYSSKQAIEEHMGGKISIFSKNNTTEVMIQLKMSEQKRLQKEGI
ncbi:MAG: response regulator receiver protein [Arcobacter sp.]|nr:MAG: response regulator receiver protein [Arcobacter sp.]